MFNAPPPFWSTHDARVAALSRRIKKVFVQLQKESELEISEGLLKDQSWNNSFKDEKVVELSQRQNGQDRIRLITGATTWGLQGEAIAPLEGATTDVDRSNPGQGCAAPSPAGNKQLEELRERRIQKEKEELIQGLRRRMRMKREEDRLQEVQNEERGEKKQVKETRAKVRSWSCLHCRQQELAGPNWKFHFGRSHMRMKSEPLMKLR